MAITQYLVISIKIVLDQHFFDLRLRPSHIRSATFLQMKKQKSIILQQPKFYQEVGAQFVVSGYIAKEWLYTDSGMLDNRIFIDLVDINGKSNWRSGEIIDIKISWLSKFRKKIWFSTTFQLYDNDVLYIEKSQGRMTIKIHGRRDTDVFFVPIIVKELEPIGGASSEIIDKHGKVEKIIAKYKNDLEDYYKELEAIRNTNPHKVNVTKGGQWNTIVNVEDEDILKSILEILSSSEEEYKEQYQLAKQAQKETALDEKYKEAIEWRGPLFGGAIMKWKGFIVTVHSHDHDSHFHVMHSGKGIDARFSFPQIELIDYKKATKLISTKEEKAIQDLFKDKNLFDKLKNEIDRRPKTLNKQ